MPEAESIRLYLPERDRSFWKNDAKNEVPLLYLAWGTRDFARQPIPASCHEGWVCVLVEDGCPTMNVRNQQIRVPAGTMALIGPECPFGWKGSPSGPAKFRLWMWRTLDLGNLGSLASNYVVSRLGRNERESFLLLHELCRQEVINTSGAENAYFKGCQAIFEVTLRRVLADDPQGREQSRKIADLAKRWMREHLDSAEPVARLCDYLNLSQSTLYRLFKIEIGVNPAAYFHQLRMEAAKAMVKAGEMSVKEIAFQLGYSHFNDLSRAYRRYFGRSPSRV
jgi:AraC family transcriptional regulator of arabinose operon